MEITSFHLKHSDFQDIALSVLQAGNDLCFQAHGNSMAPFIRDGDTIHLRQYGIYEKGDVVLVQNSEVLLVHRIVDKNRYGVITRGDASACPDPGPVSCDGILGKVYRLSGRGYNYALRPPFSRLMAIPFFSNHLFRNRLIRRIGRHLSPLVG